MNRICTMLFLALLAGCTSYNVFSDYDKSVDFSRYRTFAWLPNPSCPSDKASMFDNQIVHKNIKNYASEEMQKLGYRVDVDSPDLMLEYTVSTEHKERDTQLPVYSYPYNYNWNMSPYYDPYRRYIYGYSPPPYIMGYTTERIPYTEGTIAISVIDRKTNQLIWRGWRVGAVSDPESFEAGLPKEIRAIFSRFPRKTR